MPRQGLTNRDRPRAHVAPPIAGRGHVGFGVDKVGHAIEQIVLVADVPIERHGFGIQTLADGAHRDRLNPVAVGDLNCGHEHLVTVQPSRPTGAADVRV